MIRRLHMDRFYEKKLTWEKVITLKATESELGHGLTVIRKLIMLDHGAHIIPSDGIDGFPVMLDGDGFPVMLDHGAHIIPSDGDRVYHSKGNESNKLQQKLLNLTKKSVRDNSTTIHPQDVINVIYNCCDNMLLQILTGKLFVCRLSIPFIVPDPHIKMSKCLLWSTRGIVPEFKGVNGKLNQKSLTDIKLPIISFMRIGKLKRSKSQLLNILLSSLNHNTFFHRDCKNGTCARQDSNGTIESSYFLPSDNKAAKLKYFFAFLNLRGEATQHLQESEFLMRVSSLNIIMMNTTCLRAKTYTSLGERCERTRCQTVLCFVCESPEEADSCADSLGECVKYFQMRKLEIIDVVFDWQGNDILNFEEWKLEIENIIQQFISNHQPTLKLTDIAKIAKKEFKFRIDEDEKSCKEALKQATSLMELVKQIPETERKSKLLPLQGKFWKKWGKLQKERNRERKLDEVYIADNQGTQNKLRDEQITLYQNPSMDFIKQFFRFLMNTRAASAQQYFIIWVKLALDDCSRQILPGLHDEYHKCWSTMRKQETQEGSCDKSELNSLEKQLSDASFGLEHILRELGQIYEAGKQHKTEYKVEDEINQLPNLVANLLLKGIPFELMDGDAAFVPVTWIKAVLHELEGIIGNKKLFIVSVVGIQSSGKSTLLNTMFGLQFAVSAGRCTRGVYCQLIPVDRESTKLECDYVLVVDTEGLRAPELQETSMVHDNELATFVIGLGDITIVNIKGEIVADIQDVLQIVIHAMLRIKLVDNKIHLKPTCIFIHQNVPAVSAEEKMKFGQEKFHSFLDRMTKAAADQENIDNCTRFDQVIQFDEQKHIWYLPDLWQGEQPMATVNCAYSEKVEKIKDVIVNDIAKHSTPVTIKHFSSRIVDFWDAILHENFVFSFKNSEEIKAFSNLDVYFSKLSWDLKNDGLQLQQQAVNEIMSSKEEVQTLKDHHITGITHKLLIKQQVLVAGMEEYFETSENKDILEQWRGRYRDNLLNLCKDERDKIEKNIFKYANLREMRLKNENTAESYRDEVFKLAKQTASDLKIESESNKLTEDELNHYFDKAWSSWINKLSSTRDDEDVDSVIKTAVFIEISQYFNAHAEQLNAHLSGNSFNDLSKASFRELINIEAEDLAYGEIVEENDKKRNVIVRMWKAVTHSKSSEIQSRCLRMAADKCNEIFASIANYVKSLKEQDFQPNQASQVIRMINSFFDDMKSKRTECGFSFQTKFRIKFAVYICKCSAKEFIEMRNTFRISTDPVAKIRSDKQMLLNLFKDIYFQIEKERMAANMLSDMLSKGTKETVLRDLGRLIANNVITQDGTFLSKLIFLNRILEDLCEAKQFRGFLKYLSTGESYFRLNISEYRRKFIGGIETNGKSVIHNIIQAEVKKYIAKLTKEFDMLESNSFENHDAYFDMLQTNLTKIIACPSTDIQRISDMQAVDNFRDFTNLLKEAIQNLAPEIVKSIMLETSDVVGGLDPDELIADEVLGCSARCPFCTAPCSLTTKNHGVKHMTKQHYPQGVVGVHDKVTLKLVTENCQSLVASKTRFQYDVTKDVYEPYRDYNKHFPTWEIAADTSMEASVYWKWFMATYHDDLVKAYGVKHADMPSLWKKFTMEDAKKSLQQEGK